MTSTVPEISRCRGCQAGSEYLKEAFRMDPMPLAGQFCKTPNEATQAVAFPLSWAQCTACGLVQVIQEVPDEILFTDYNYASSSITSLSRHFDAFAELLIKRYPGSVQILEIGCNDGVLLTKLPASWKRVGVDPSDVAERAVKEHAQSYELINESFNIRVIEENGLTEQFDVVTGSNCFAHISNIAEVFRGAYLALRPKGDFWLEVHDLGALLSSRQWDTIYHEHKMEWSLDALQRCIEPIGFTLQLADRIDLHGGSLRCCFKKVSSDKIRGQPPDQREDFDSLQLAFDSRYETKAARLLCEAQRRNIPFAAYGAAGRANVYLNQMRELKFKYIVDEAPLRAGKFLPCVATPVVAPEILETNPAHFCLITAWNYRDAIVKKNARFRGDWLTAFEA